jgi:hypothetical protein
VHAEFRSHNVKAGVKPRCHSKAILVLLVVFGFCCGAFAQLLPFETDSARSMSGQFVVRTANGISKLPSTASSTPASDGNDETITLSPSLAAVSCERIKQAVWRELELSGNWGGKILITLRPARGSNDTVTVVCSRFNNGWNYQMDMPQTVTKRRFMRAIVQTLLLEFANRNGGRRSAEIPHWLSEGIVQTLLSGSETELMPPPPEKSVNGVMITRSIIEKSKISPVDGSMIEPLDAARGILSENPPLSVKQISWPTDQQLTGMDGGVYEKSAQLFTTELMRLDDGPSCFRTMLAELAGCYNWQTAFFRAFKSHFTDLLDLEKWWALQMVYFTGHDPMHRLTLEESRQKLDEALIVTAQLRRQASELPVPTDVPLQTVIKEWDFASQKIVLYENVTALDRLRFHVAPELTDLVSDYHRTLAGYLDQRTKASYAQTSTRFHGLTVASAVWDTVRKLDKLDRQRAALRVQTDSTAVQ